MTTLSQEQFEVLFRDTPRTIPQFNPVWHNGTGYFDKLTTEKVQQYPVKTVDENDRRIVIIPLAIGENLVIFERYPNDSETIAFNAPHPRTSNAALEIHQQVIKGHPQRFDNGFTINDVIRECQGCYN